MQQLSGSSGLGGTRTPAISVLAASISRARLEAPERREPKTARAFSRVLDSAEAVGEGEGEEEEDGGAGASPGGGGGC